MNNHLSSSLNTKKTMTCDIGNTGPGLGQAQKCDGVKLINGIPTPPRPLDNWIPP